MPGQFSIKIINSDKFIEAAKRYPAETATQISRAIYSTILIYRRLASMKAPVDRGNLSGTYWRETYNADGAISGRLENVAPYAMYVHGDGSAERSAPHWPPMEAIEGWANRHGIPPFLVARSIARKGTPLVPFLKDAIEECEPERKMIFENALSNLIKTFQI